MEPGHSDARRAAAGARSEPCRCPPGIRGEVDPDRARRACGIGVRRDRRDFFRFSLLVKLSVSCRRVPPASATILPTRIILRLPNVALILLLHELVEQRHWVPKERSDSPEPGELLARCMQPRLTSTRYLPHANGGAAVLPQASDDL